MVDAKQSKLILMNIERQMKFLYFLHDLGIEEAKEPAKHCWTTYCSILVALMSSETYDL